MSQSAAVSSSAQAQLAFHEQFHDRLHSLLGPDIYGNGHRIRGYPTTAAPPQHTTSEPSGKPRAGLPNVSFQDQPTVTATIDMTPPPPPAVPLQTPPRRHPTAPVTEAEDHATSSWQPSPWRELQSRLSAFGTSADTSPGPLHSEYGASTRSPRRSRSEAAVNRLQTLSRRAQLPPEEVSALLAEVELALAETTPDAAVTTPKHGSQRDERATGTPSRTAPPPPSFSQTYGHSQTAPSSTVRSEAPLPPPPPPPPLPASASVETLEWYRNYYHWMLYYQQLYAAAAANQPPQPPRRRSTSGVHSREGRDPSENVARCRRCSHAHHHHNHGNSDNEAPAPVKPRGPNRRSDPADESPLSTRPPWVSPTSRPPTGSKSAREVLQSPRRASAAHPAHGWDSHYADSPRRPAPAPPVSGAEPAREAGAGRGASPFASPATMRAARQGLQDDLADLASRAARMQTQGQQHQPAEPIPQRTRDWRTAVKTRATESAEPATRGLTHQRTTSTRQGKGEFLRAFGTSTGAEPAAEEVARSRSTSSVYERKKQELANERPSWRY